MICSSCAFTVDNILYDEGNALIICPLCGSILDSSFVIEEEIYKELDKISDEVVKLLHRLEMDDYDIHHSKVKD
jgi:hypothetical protein